jgi:hypothetical protein
LSWSGRSLLVREQERDRENTRKKGEEKTIKRGQRKEKKKEQRAKLYGLHDRRALRRVILDVDGAEQLGQEGHHVERLTAQDAQKECSYILHGFRGFLSSEIQH